MNFEEYRSHDATALSSMVRKKEIKAVELVEIAIRRAESVNPKINAIVHNMYESARKTAAEPDRSAPFSGIPFLIKDLGIEVAGTPKTEGSKAYRNYVSATDSILAKRLRQAGFIFLGKTNTPELGLTPFTEPQLHGPTNNPWDLSRTPGGSSGGSAAAVAAGITPLATASDGGGSIRIPASCCGLFGLKPSRGRISLGMQQGEMWSGAVSEGCVSRSVRDSANFLDCVRGAAHGDPFVIRPPKRPYAEEVHTPPKRLRIGFSTQHTLGHTIADDNTAAVRETAKLLESLGHALEEVPLPYQKEDLTKVFIMMVMGETAASIESLSEHLGRKAGPSDVEPLTWAQYLLGQAYSAKDYALQRRKWNNLARRMGAFHETFDLLLTPTVATPPFPTGSLQATAFERRLLGLINTFGLSALLKARADDIAEKIFEYIPHTPITNMTGQPSASIPLYWTKQNLPVGVMFTAPFGREDLLFRLAGQLEEARPWFHRVPEL